MTELTVNSLSLQQYHFLLLMGHWEYLYDNEGQPENFNSGTPPTLLAAGLTSWEITGAKEERVEIAMYPIQVDTKFAPSVAEGGSFDQTKTAYPFIVGCNPRVAILSAGSRWRFQWTVKGDGAYEVLKLAQQLAKTDTTSNGVKFYSQNTYVETKIPDNASVVLVGSTPNASLGPINWKDNTEFSVTADIPISNQTPGPLDKDVSGWGYFNLAYVPCYKTDDDWGGG